MAGHGLVDGVVHDLVDEVVETSDAGGADVHPGPLADGLEALQDLDVLCAVLFCGLGHDAVFPSRWMGEKR